MEINFLVQCFFSILLILLDPSNRVSATQCRYTGLQNDYLRWRKAYQGVDLLPSYSKTKKKSLCRSFIYTNTYIYVDKPSNTEVEMHNKLLAPGSAQSNTKQFISVTPDFKVQKMKIHVGSDDSFSVNVFECTTDKQNNVYYLTYAYEDESAVVLSVPKGTDISQDTNALFYSLVQPNATIDHEFMETNAYFLHSFWGHYIFKSFSDHGVKLPAEMSLCSVTDNQHFQICSVVENALQDIVEFFELSITILRYNHIYKIPQRCVVKTIKDEEFNLKVSNEVLPCAINQDWSKPQFFLLRDPLHDPDQSVFVLKLAEDDTLTLITRIDNVRPLAMK